MYNTFISIVGIINSAREAQQLNRYLTHLYGVLQANFSDFEIILVNNGHLIQEVDAVIKPLDEALKKNIFLLNLSNQINTNHAAVAGLDRANGDYTILWEFDFADEPTLILDLYQKTLEQYDMVYLRAKERNIGLRFRFLTYLFYAILKRYSNLELDEMAHNTRIISRRSLNSLLRLRENLRYMKALYSIVGYRTTHLLVDAPLVGNPQERFSERFRTSLVAITSFTNFLRSVLLAIFIASFVFLIYVVINAISVKMTNYDIFGYYHEALSGWAFLVILISVFFAVTCLNLYIMSIYLSNIYHEIKQRPLYIIESIKRY